MPMLMLTHYELVASIIIIHHHHHHHHPYHPHHNDHRRMCPPPPAGFENEELDRPEFKGDVTPSLTSDKVSSH
jgi:hypothetical protein